MLTSAYFLLLVVAFVLTVANFISERIPLKVPVLLVVVALLVGAASRA